MTQPVPSSIVNLRKFVWFYLTGGDDAEDFDAGDGSVFASEGDRVVGGERGSLG